MSLHLPGKEKQQQQQRLRVPVTHPLPLIVQIAFGVSEHTSCQIQLNCLNIRGALARVALDGLLLITVL